MTWRRSVQDVGGADHSNQVYLRLVCQMFSPACTCHLAVAFSRPRYHRVSTIWPLKCARLRQPQHVSCYLYLGHRGCAPDSPSHLQTPFGPRVLPTSSEHQVMPPTPISAVQFFPPRAKSPSTECQDWSGRRTIPWQQNLTLQHGMIT